MKDVMMFLALAALVLGVPILTICIRQTCLKRYDNHAVYLKCWPSKAKEARFIFAQFIVFVFAFGIIADIYGNTDRAMQKLRRLKTDFANVANTGPDSARPHADERGAALDYGGRLDAIIAERDAIIKSAGYVTLGLEWKTGEGVAFSGLYLDLGDLLLACVWLLGGGMALWLAFNPFESKKGVEERKEPFDTIAVR